MEKRLNRKENLGSAVYTGGNVWESNPPETQRASRSALKAGGDTSTPSAPMKLKISYHTVAGESQTEKGNGDTEKEKSSIKEPIRSK